MSNALNKLLKPGKWLSKLICFLTGHPVDVMSGRVLADAVDFELPGPIPLVFERNYDSRDRYEGPLGPAWHHPLDVSVHETYKFRPILKVRLPDGRESTHIGLDVGESTWDPIDRFTLLRTKKGYRLTFWDGLAYHLEPVRGAHVSHSLVKITRRCDNAVELFYRGGRLAQVVDSLGRKLDFDVKEGRLRSVRLRMRDGDRLDLVHYDYDKEGRLAAAFDAKGHPCRYAYDGGVLVKETNRNGLSFYFEYNWNDPEGWCTRTWGDGGIYDRRIFYDEIMHVTIVDDGRGGKTQYRGNDAGLVDLEISPQGVYTRYEWDSVQYVKTAQIDGEVDGVGDRTEWEYDARGNLIRETDALGHETRWSYNDLNLELERVDALGSTWKHQYDSRGKLVRATNPLGEVTRFKHDKRGNLVSVEDAKGRTARLRYTPAGELCEVIDAEGGSTAIAFDDRGLLIRHIDATGGETLVQRDACGRAVAVKRPDDSVIHLAYDPEGNLVEHADALGNATRMVYGGFNKLVERIDPAGGSVRYELDKEDDVIAVVNEAGERYEIERDPAGRIVRERGFDGRALRLMYDRKGRVCVMFNAEVKRTFFEYDALGRLVRQTVPRKPILGDPIPEGERYEYAYDALGRLVLAKNPACEVIFTRDALGRVVEERSTPLAPPIHTTEVLEEFMRAFNMPREEPVLGDLTPVTIASRYDAAGDRIGRRTSLGHEASFDFDGNGDLLGVTFGTGSLWGDFGADALASGVGAQAPWRATFTRDALGNELERRLPGGVVSRRERHAMGRPRIQRLAHNDAPLGAVGYRWRSADQLAGLIDRRSGSDEVEVTLRENASTMTGRHTISYARYLATLRGAAKIVLKELRNLGYTGGGEAGTLQTRLEHLLRLEAEIRTGGLP
jgi:YD repeat-containing protein